MKALAVLGAFIAGATIVDDVVSGLVAIAACVLVAALLVGFED